ncbi:MAG: hypothetical protein ACK5NU_16345 [Fusobacterium ulcerans]|uniref:hypothetical protein n=1 Tax=Fusobacterium ulcerans TaxID=861 RepID=UPI003A84711F
MKKIILLFSILSFFILSGCGNEKDKLKKEIGVWKVIDLTNDFNEKTGERKVIQVAKDGKTTIVLGIHEVFPVYTISVLTDTHIEDKEEITIKIDDKEPFNTPFFRLEEEREKEKGIFVFVERQLEKELKNGKIMKILLNVSKEEKILIEVNIKNIEKQFKKVVKNKIRPNLD